MSVPPKNQRKYPYDTGLKFCSDIDIVIANPNREPIDASEYFGKAVSVSESGGTESQGHKKSGSNRYELHNGMARIRTQFSFCRAYSTDNIWWVMKYIIGALKKKAFLSTLPYAIMDDDGKPLIATGELSVGVHDMGIYGNETNLDLHRMTYKHKHESHKRLLDNIRLTVGLISLLLDPRETTESLRKQYAPFDDKDFHKGKEKLTYRATSNFWLFSPVLAHLMFGAARFAYFIAHNTIEEEIWEGFEPADVYQAIYHNDYKAAREIWELAAARFKDAGYLTSANPFTSPAAEVLELLFDHGVAMIGDGIYTNWRMNRMKKNFRGHFQDLPSWERGSHQRVFSEKHPRHEIFKQYLEKQKNAKR